MSWRPLIICECTLKKYVTNDWIVYHFFFKPSLPRDDTGRPVGDVVRRVELLLAGAEDGVEVVDGVEAVVVERKLPERKEKPVL